MIPYHFKGKSIVVAVIFTWSLVLNCILYFNMKLSSLPAEVVLTKTAIKLALTKNKSVTPLEPQKYLKFVEISGTFRKTILRNHDYWNMQQNTLLKQLDSVARPEGNTLEWEEPVQTLCNLTNLEVLQASIKGYNSYSPLLQDFIRGMHCRDPPILIDQPNKCPWTEGEGRPFLLLAIKSSSRNFEQRQVVRDTWGREGTYDGELEVRTVFLLGSNSSEDPSLEEMVRFEALYYGDILQWDFRDTFYNLTLKDNAFLGWAQQRCPGTSFIFKGDDDVFVNQQAVVNFLRSLKPSNASTLYCGHIIYQASAIHDKNSKYYLPHSFFNGPYPSYAGGGGFLFSGLLVRPLYQVSRHIALFPIDDVYTGMCFQALGITPIRHPAMHSFDISEKDRKNTCVYKKLLMVHKRIPQEVLHLWRLIHSPQLNC